jgi:RNA polymerase sigma-70 factor (ECF subfamily)
MDSRNEKILVQQAAAGDARAFDAIVTLHSQRVIQLAWRLVGSREDAEDLAQEAFIRLHRSLADFRGDAALATWFYRTVSRLAIDFLRREHLRRRLFWFRQSEEEADPREQAAAPGASPAQELLAAEQRQRLRNALRLLSPRQRTIFVLRNDEGLALKEIAGLLGLEEGTVKIHLHRAVAKLTAELADIGET